MSTPLLSLKNVDFEYEVKGGLPFLALKEVSFDIRAGDYVAVVGTSGSGKTTLMNLLGLMATPTRGIVEFEGHDVSKLEKDDAARTRNRKIGFVFQSFHLLQRLTTLENVMLPSLYGEYCDNAEERATELLNQLGIADQSEKVPNTLSGGQRQRSAIARALFSKPSLLLADEPTGALDSKTTESVLSLLDELNKLGHTLIIITHNPDVAARAARILRITDGRIVADEYVRNLPKQNNAADTKRDYEQDDGVNYGVSLFRTGMFAPLFLRLRKAARTAKQYAEVTGDSILTNRLRSLLTISGLAVGIIAIILMMTLSKESEKAFLRFADSVGATKSYVMFDGREAERLGARRWRGLHVELDFPPMQKLFTRFGTIEPATSHAVTCKEGSAAASSQEKAISQVTLSTLRTREAFASASLKVAKGREFTVEEYSNSSFSPVVLLGSKAVEKHFPRSSDIGYSQRTDYPLGATVSGCGMVMTVVGILDEIDSDFGADLNENVYIPLKTAISRGFNPYAKGFQLTPKPGVQASEFASAFTNYLKVYTNNKYPFRFFSAEQQIERLQMMMSILSITTLIIGGLCIIIGGIGVMNIMLVSITERVKEIGIRKAVGARRAHILNQFLGESVIFCLLSGILGVLVGVALSNGIIYSVSRLVPKYISFSFNIDSVAVLWALGTSVVTGILFGVAPARKASDLDVVEALRSD
jgi:macrolide transport system ATP-binding/permease protein